jgi:hypothetical protein
MPSYRMDIVPMCSLLVICCDIQEHAQFVSEPYGDHFLCLTNSINSKKKRFDYNYADQYFSAGFTTLTGEPVYIEEFCFDFPLVGED